MRVTLHQAVVSLTVPRFAFAFTVGASACFGVPAMERRKASIRSKTFSSRNRGSIVLTARPLCLVRSIATTASSYRSANVAGSKSPALLSQDVLGELQHILGDGHVREIVEVAGGLAHLVGVEQRGPHEPLAPWLQHDHAFPLRQHHAAERDHGLAAHSVADDGEGVLADLVVGHKVVRRIEIALVDLRARHEAVDVDRMLALDGDVLELVVLDQHIIAFADLVASRYVRRLDQVAGVLVDELLLEAMAGLAIDRLSCKRCSTTFSGLNRLLSRRRASATAD